VELLSLLFLLLDFLDFLVEDLVLSLDLVEEEHDDDDDLDFDFVLNDLDFFLVVEDDDLDFFLMEEDENDLLLLLSLFDLLVLSFSSELSLLSSPLRPRFFFRLGPCCHGEEPHHGRQLP